MVPKPTARIDACRAIPKERSILDSIRRIVEQQEMLRRIADPFGDLIRRLDPVGDAMKHLGAQSELMRFIKAEEDRRRLLSGIGDDYHLAGFAGGALAHWGEEAERHRKLLEGSLTEVRRLGMFSGDSELQRSMSAAMEAYKAYERMFRRPELEEIGRLAQGAQCIGTLAASVFGQGRLGGALEAAMGAMHSPWLNIEHVDRSARAFAQLQAIGQIVNECAPFGATLGRSLRPGLGDWRDRVTVPLDQFMDPAARSDFYIRQGFDPTLTDFTVRAFEESVDAAGLGEPCEPAPSVEAENQIDDDGFVRARTAFDRLQRFEIVLRRFIEKVMCATYGNGWMKHQLPNGMLDAWRAKRDAAVKAGAAECPLIEYADFADYRQIIERSDNWKAVFKPVFGRPEDVRESLQRLFPVRIATMHARIVTLDDELLLLVETKRVMRAIVAVNG